MAKLVKFNVPFFENGLVKYEANGMYDVNEETERCVAAGHADFVNVKADLKLIQKLADEATAAEEAVEAAKNNVETLAAKALEARQLADEAQAEHDAAVEKKGGNGNTQSAKKTLTKTEKEAAAKKEADEKAAAEQAEKEKQTAEELAAKVKAKAVELSGLTVEEFDALPEEMRTGNLEAAAAELAK